jgi:hypothetical protein
VPEEELLVVLQPMKTIAKNVMVIILFLLLGFYQLLKYKYLIISRL